MTLLPDPVTDALARLAPDVAVCLVADGPDDLGIAGVTDFATAQAWRLHDAQHRAFMMFRYGKLGEPDVRVDEEEPAMAQPLLPAPKIPKRRMKAEG